MTGGGGVAALRADRLGKRYGRSWGLRDCTFSVPAGSVVGLVGPNGAGKTTLLSLTAGLLAPTEGQIAVFGQTSRARTADTLARVSYLAQDRPLYRGFSVADMFRLGRSMNPRWDQELARARMDALGIPLPRKIKTLSGGQQAQVALTMALAKRAPLLALIWVTWRQHRPQALASLALFGVLGAFAVVVGLQTRAAFSSDGLPACLARSGGAGCPAVITSFVDRFGHGVGSIMNVPLLAIPGLLGVIVGAPLLGRELERGTWRLAWSQTVPRTRWLVTKLGLVTGGLVVFGAAVTVVVAWSHAPLYRVTSRLQPVPFNGDGLTFTASLLCAFGLAVLAGLLLRNTIAAIVVAYIGWEIPTTVVALMGGPIHIPAPAVMRIGCPARCPGASASAVPPVTGHLGDYVLGVTRTGGELVVSYLPASRFWIEQLIEGGLYLAVAVAALGAAVWLLHRRTS
jgi:ABC-type transport system involved in cytochrome c biogenesis ATPase subunit